MAILQIGRIGAEVDWSHIARMRQIVDRRQGGGLRLEGGIRGSTLAETNVIRSELLALTPGAIVPVTFSKDSEIDGFYRVLFSDVEADAEEAAVNGKGWFNFAVALQRLGADSNIAFKTRLTGTALDTSHSGITAEDYYAPPGSFTMVDPRNTDNTARATENSGNLYVYFNNGSTTSWSVAPSNWYNAACYVKVGSYIRQGLIVPNSPTDWEIGNEIVRVSPSGTSGNVDIDAWTGSAWTSKEYAFEYDVSNTVGAWDAITVLRNDAEAVTIRLMGARNLTDGGAFTLDLNVRRGARFVTGVLSHSSLATLRVARSTTDAGSTSTLTNMGAIQESPTSGNRYVMASADAVTLSTTNGHIESSSTTNSFDFMVGWVIGSATEDNPASLVNQYHGWRTESVWPVRR